MDGYSLHIGLTEIDKKHYGWDGKLNACINDATDMQYISSSLGYKTTLLTNEDATRTNVKAQIEKLAKKSKAGDIVVITYSGHGSVKPDFNSDEDDGLDETWCLFDGELIDDELKVLWTLFKAEVRVLFISDSCFSGDVFKMGGFQLNNLHSIISGNAEELKVKHKATPMEIAYTTYYKNQKFYDEILKDVPKVSNNKIKASIISISASQSNQYAYDGFFNSEFTKYLKKVWNGGKFSGNYRQFHRKITQSIIKPQTPVIKYAGQPNPEFYKQNPFQIK